MNRPLKWNVSNQVISYAPIRNPPGLPGVNWIKIRSYPSMAEILVGFHRRSKDVCPVLNINGVDVQIFREKPDEMFGKAMVTNSTVRKIVGDDIYIEIGDGS